MEVELDEGGLEGRWVRWSWVWLKHVSDHWFDSRHDKLFQNKKPRGSQGCPNEGWLFKWLQDLQRNKLEGLKSKPGSVTIL